MSTTDAKLNELFDLAPEDTTNATLPAVVVEGEVLPAVVETPPPPQEHTLDRDFEFARQEIRDTIQRVSLTVTDAITLAQSGDQPRAYEVVGNLLTAIVNANKELVELHRSRSETLRVKQATAPAGSGHSEQGGVKIEKAVFVGRASDLLREIRALEKAKVEVPDNAS